MIPAFEPSTGLLPAGIHEATWAAFVARFGSTPGRLRLLAGLKAALDALRAGGCRRAYIDGSFVKAKAVPADFDACWEPDGVNPDRLDPVLLTFDQGRRAQKTKFGGELFPADWPAEPSGTTFLSFFQRDRNDRPKGIVAIDLGALP
jgi:hypothetical protein